MDPEMLKYSTNISEQGRSENVLSNHYNWWIIYWLIFWKAGCSSYSRDQLLLYVVLRIMQQLFIYCHDYNQHCFPVCRLSVVVIQLIYSRKAVFSKQQKQMKTDGSVILKSSLTSSELPYVAISIWNKFEEIIVLKNQHTIMQ